MTLDMYLATLEWRRLAELAEACDSEEIAPMVGVVSDGACVIPEPSAHFRKRVKVFAASTSSWNVKARRLVRNTQGVADMHDEKTRAGKSSPNILIPVVEPALSPLVPEARNDGRRAKRWIDIGTPDNSAHEYPGWR